MQIFFCTYPNSYWMIPVDVQSNRSVNGPKVHKQKSTLNTHTDESSSKKRHKHTSKSRQSPNKEIKPTDEIASLSDIEFIESDSDTDDDREFLADGTADNTDTDDTDDTNDTTDSHADSSNVDLESEHKGMDEAMHRSIHDEPPARAKRKSVRPIFYVEEQIKRNYGLIMQGVHSDEYEAALIDNNLSNDSELDSDEYDAEYD